VARSPTSWRQREGHVLRALQRGTRCRGDEEEKASGKLNWAIKVHQLGLDWRAAWRWLGTRARYGLRLRRKLHNISFGRSARHQFWSSRELTRSIGDGKAQRSKMERPSYSACVLVYASRPSGERKSQQPASLSRITVHTLAHRRLPALTRLRQGEASRPKTSDTLTFPRTSRRRRRARALRAMQSLQLKSCS